MIALTPGGLKTGGKSEINDEESSAEFLGDAIPAVSGMSRGESL